jgi:hypothetical protein
MTITERPADPSSIGVRSDADRNLRSAADLVARSISIGALLAGAAFLLGLAFPVLLFIGPLWLVLLPAAAAGGVGSAALLVIARALGWRVHAERTAVLLGATVLAAPMLFTFAVVFGPSVGVSWWVWLPAAVLIPLFAYRGVLRDPFDTWRPVLVRLFFGLGLALGALGFMLFAFIGAWSAWGSDDGSRTLASLVTILIAGALGLGALLVSVGPFANAAARAAAWGGAILAVACVVALMLGLALRSTPNEPEAGPMPEAPVPEVWSDPETGHSGDQPRPDVPEPTVEEAREQFAALADATAEAAGVDAIWRDSPAVPVLEEACEGGIRLRIDAELAMGVITDTTTDEHDRAVTEQNLAAADRIVHSWAALGLGTAEIIHGEPILGGAALAAVDHAKVDFAFGVAQPRVEGRCLLNR